MNYRRKLIVTDGVFSIDGNIAPLPQIVQIAENYDAWIIVDDVHATGVLWKNGTGTAKYFGIPGKIQLTAGTVSKAIGCEGCFLAANSIVINYLKNRARSFIYKTSLSPGTVGAAIQALHMIQNDHGWRNHLHQNSKYLRQGLVELGYKVIDGETPIIAVVIGDPTKACELPHHLEEARGYAHAIRPPTDPKGKSRIPVTVMANYGKNQLNMCTTVLRKLVRKWGLFDETKGLICDWN